jgi:ABC-type transporter Mla subunit MlaD
MQRLQRVAHLLKQHGQADLAAGVADISMALRGVRAAAGDYDRLFQDLVKVVDDFTDAAKRADAGRRTIQAIVTKAEASLPEGSDELYGFKQEVEWLLDALNAADQATQDLERAYDDLNKRALRYKMR